MKEASVKNSDLKRKISLVWQKSFSNHLYSSVHMQGSVSDDIEGRCMLLRRLAYPVRYSDLVNRFARSVPVLYP